MLHSFTRSRDDEPRRRGTRQRGIDTIVGRAAQGRNAQRREGVVAEKEAQQMKQIGDAVVDRGGCDEEDAAANDETRESPIPVGVGIAKTVGFVDYDKIGARTSGRPDGPPAQGFVRDDGCIEDAVAIQ